LRIEIEGNERIVLTKYFELMCTGYGKSREYGQINLFPAGV
jgi:hypothetical protein